MPPYLSESEIDHYTGHYVPYSFTKSVWVLYRPIYFITCARACETGPTVYRTYPRRLESLTVCKCYYKGCTLSVGPAGV